MNIRIRTARPEDAPLLAWVMLAAGRSHMERGIWDVIISQPEDKCLAFLELLAVAEPHNMCHCSEFLVAEVDGKPAAALSGYDPREGLDAAVGEAMPGVAAKLGLTEADMAAGEKGLASFMTCHSDDYEGAWIVEHVATLPEYRKLGVISKLLEEILEKGRRRGHDVAQVSFYIGNTPAQRAYEKCGFRFHDEKRHPDFEAEIGCPGMTRLLCEL